MYINRLINIFLLGSRETGRLDIPVGKLKELKENCYYYTISALSETNNLDLDKFNMIFNILLAKNYKKRGGRPIYPIRSRPRSDKDMFSINDLSEIVSKSEISQYARIYLTTSLRNDNPLASSTCKDFQTILFDDDLIESNSAMKAFFNRIGAEMPMDSIHKYLVRYRPYSLDGYHGYFLEELRITQQKELLDISLGLDVYLGEFYDNIARLGISRHHPDRDKSYYCLFHIDENTGKWRVKLIPLKWEGHREMHQLYKNYGKFYKYYEVNELVTARFTHLVELMFKRSYVSGTDYKTLLMTEFRNKVGKIAGNNIKIWKGIDDRILKEWIERWENKKILSEKKWYSKYYNNFYTQTYIPRMDSFASYLLKGDKAKRSSFWRWFLNTYLRENKYP